MKKFILLTALIISPFTYAGGTSMPSVEPAMCIKKTYSWNTFIGFSWDGSDECNEVVDKGYAKGVHYSGVFVSSNEEEIPLDGYITPYQSYEPSSIKGKELKTLITNKIQWSN